MTVKDSIDTTGLVLCISQMPIGPCLKKQPASVGGKPRDGARSARARRPLPAMPCAPAGEPFLNLAAIGAKS